MGVAQRTVVAMSGGVDSAVAAGLLREAGRDLVGVTLHLWDSDAVGRCCAPEDREDARRVCEHLGIPFHVLDAREAFRAEVVDPFVADNLAGLTPSPCVTCNRTVKLEHLAKLAGRFGASTVATGHYARIDRSAGARPRLLRGVDPGKDQSYFLFGLSPETLDRLEFPLGGMDKQRARREAHRLGLPNADKPDSQELCFVPDGDVRAFVEREGGARQSGAIVDLAGRSLGHHEGICGFTVGQRRGLGLGGGPARYVLRVVPERDEVVVGPAERLQVTELSVGDVHWRMEAPQAPFEAQVQIRHRHPAAAALVTPTGEGFDAVFAEGQRAAAAGQASVLYMGDEVVAGGFIRSAR